MINITITELHRIFDLLNKSFFENKLEQPIILIQTKTKRTMGTCSVNKIWKRKTKDDTEKYEITLSAEYLNRTNEEIVATLLHEMVHLYNSLNQIKDTSNNFVYHNKRFKEEAERRGLVINHAKTIGWSVTTLQDPTKELIKTFNIMDQAFDYYRKAFLLETTKIPTNPLNSYSCPGCQTKINSRKILNLICGDCNKKFEKKEELLLIGNK